MRHQTALLDRASPRGFTERQVDLIEMYMRARIKAHKHSQMEWVSSEIDDVEGVDHHSFESRMHDRAAWAARRHLVKLGIGFGTRKRNGSQTFYSKKKRPLVVAENEIEMME